MAGKYTLTTISILLRTWTDFIQKGVNCISQANWILGEIAASHENEKRLRDFLAERDPSGNVKVEKIHTCPEVALNDALAEMEDLLSRHAQLSAYQWIGLFYTLCYLGITKSILIDTRGRRAEYEEHSRWRSSDAICTCSAYRAWISIFSWCSLCDYLLTDQDGGGTSGVDLNVKDMFRQTQKMVRQEKWKERGIKSSKDFLMGLGTGSFQDRTYNGFFSQKYRLDQIHLRGRAEHSTDTANCNQV